MSSTPDDKEQNSRATSSWYGCLPNSWVSVLDQQRVERLDQCRILDEVLSECQRKKDSPLAPRLQLEDVAAGVRMVRYYDWRNVVEGQCQREEHAVWSCRAIALGCGTQLQDLRHCFHSLPEKTSILETTETAYEPRTASENEFPCREYQELIGKCVATNLRELAARRSESQ